MSLVTLLYLLLALLHLSRVELRILMGLAYLLIAAASFFGVGVH